jgi:hypothetical protein
LVTSLINKVKERWDKKLFKINSVAMPRTSLPRERKIGLCLVSKLLTMVSGLTMVMLVLPKFVTHQLRNDLHKQ